MSERQLSSLSIFFPCYNDAGTIASAVLLAVETAKEVTNDYEIIVIDDGSTDGSRAILKTLEELYPCLRVVYHERNRGYGGALRSGFANARKEFIFYTDGDLQYDPRDLLRLVPLMDDGVGLVNGYKLKRADPWHRIVIGKIYHVVNAWLFGIKIRDIDCDMRLIRSEVMKDISLESDGGHICVELIRKLQDNGVVMRETGVPHYHRRSGSSQFFSLPNVVVAVLGIVQLWWRLVMFRNKGPSGSQERLPKSTSD